MLATVWQVANQHSTNRSARPGRRRATHRSSVFWELQGHSASPRSIRSHAHRPFFFEIFAVMGVAPSRQTILRFTGLWLQSTVDSLQPVDMPCLPGEATMQVWLSVVAPRSGPEPKRAQRVPTRATRALREGWQTSLDEISGWVSLPILGPNLVDQLSGFDLRTRACFRFESRLVLRWACLRGGYSGILIVIGDACGRASGTAKLPKKYQQNTAV